MRIWFESEGILGTKKSRFFAVVEEEMIDKNGRPVPVAAKVAEPEIVPEVVAEETAPETVAVVEVNDDERFDNLEKKIAEINDKVDVLIAAMEKEQTTEETTPETVEEVTEEVVEEPAEVVVEVTEEVVEEPAEVVEEVTEEVVEEPIEVVEEVTEEVAPETTEEVTEEVAPEATEEVTEEVAEEITEAPAESVDGELAAAAIALDGEELPEKKAYVRSPNFAEKMMAASEIIQDRYDELKNYALRYRKLKSRISKKFDSINMGRFHFVKLSVAGKTLKLYLNMDYSTVDPKFRCVDMSNKKTYVTVPVMLRIKSGRAMKYAKRLIDQCAQQHEMLERRKPFEVDSMQLIEEALNAKNELPENDELTAATDVSTEEE